MPRLSHQLLLHARSLHPLLPVLVRTCRDLQSARNELRWLREHAFNIAVHNFIELREILNGQHVDSADSLKRSIDYASTFSVNVLRDSFRSMCMQRGRGVPLQYIIGTEYFGDLELLCKPGVLIPRQETADIVTALAERLSRNRPRDRPLRILDLCTGTGCMSLLMHKLLKENTFDLQILGIDISTKAVKLARANLLRSVPLNVQPNLAFKRADILADSDSAAISTLGTTLLSVGVSDWDVLISNPPYISPSKYLSTTTARSVRNFEPRLALLPVQGKLETTSSDARGDIFYPVLLRHALAVKAKVVLLEVGDYAQAFRVARMAVEQGIWDGGVEIWRNNLVGPSQIEEIAIGERQMLVRGTGQGRCVICWKKTWL